MGRSRGGFGTKIHIAVDALANPVDFILTPGQEADVTQAVPLIRRNRADAYILDKAYDSGGGGVTGGRGRDPVEEEPEGAA